MKCIEKLHFGERWAYVIRWGRVLIPYGPMDLDGRGCVSADRFYDLESRKWLDDPWQKPAVKP